MRSSAIAWIGVLLGCMPLPAQSRPPAQVRLRDALPPDARPKQLAPSADARRIYYTDSAGHIWRYDRGAGSSVRLDTANHWDLGFIFTGERHSLPSNAAWDQLTFVDVATLKRDEIVRSQVDVLAYAGKLVVR